MTKKIIFFSIISLLLFFLLSDFSLAAKTPCGPGMPDCPEGQLCVTKKVWGVERSACERKTELSYPGIPGGGVVPETTATGLPDYVKYIFQLSVIIIGFVIFGALMKSGIQYLVSTGDPAKLTDAREGIFSAFLGAIILLSAYIIFNTINPQLTILKLAEVSPVGGVVVPGVYICNFNVDDMINKQPEYERLKKNGWTFDKILEAYIDKDWKAKDDPAAAERQSGAAQELKALNCARGTSNNLNGWVVKPNNTMFIVPKLSYVYNNAAKTTVKIVKYEYGIVLHEKDNWRGQCDYFPKEGPDRLIYTYTPTLPIPYIPNVPTGCNAGGKGQQIDECRPKDLAFEARSITVFQKPNTEPPLSARGVFLYPCIDFSSTPGMCPEGVNPTGRNYSTVGADILKPRTADLYELAENTRSIFIEPEGSYFALLFDEDNFEGECAGAYSSSRDVRNWPLQKVGPDCANWRIGAGWLPRINPRECALGVKSMIVIKGETI